MSKQLQTLNSLLEQVVFTLSQANLSGMETSEFLAKLIQTNTKINEILN
jgi:hypothetical protein